MKRLLLLFLLTTLYSCQEKKFESVVEETPYVASEDIAPAPKIEKKKYFYTVLSLYKPSIERLPGNSDYGYYIEDNISLSTSPVSDTNAWDEDTKYQILDMYENALSGELETANKAFQYGIKAINVDSQGKRARVVTRDIYFFDTYKEASMSRRKVMDDPGNYKPQKQ